MSGSSPLGSLTTRCRRNLRGLSLFLWIALAAPGQAEPLPAELLANYQQKPAAKALAVAGDEGATVTGMAYGHGSDLHAAHTALHECERQRQTRPVQQPCELRLLNQLTLTSADALRAQVPSGARPLFLWHFRMHDSEVYLAGSIHALKSSLYPLPQQYEQAFTRADHLVLELDLANPDPAMVEIFNRMAPLGPNERLDAMLPPKTLRALLAYVEAQQLPAQQVLRLKPMLLATQISLMQLSALGYVAEHGMEAHFLRQAGQRPVIGLETFETQLQLLTGQPLRAQIAALEAALVPLAETHDQINALVLAWLAGDDAALKAQLYINQDPAYLEFLNLLLDARNQTMAQTLIELTQHDGVYFVLVGAAHLIGPQGMPALLAAAGFTGTRIQSTAQLH